MSRLPPDLIIRHGVPRDPSKPKPTGTLYSRILAFDDGRRDPASPGPCLPAGELPGVRQSMDRFAARLVSEGASGSYATTKSRECAVRLDRRKRER